MVDVRNTIAGWEKKQAPLSDDLQRFLDLVWSHRKRQDKPDPKNLVFGPVATKPRMLMFMASTHGFIGTSGSVQPL